MTIKEKIRFPDMAQKARRARKAGATTMKAAKEKFRDFDFPDMGMAERARRVRHAVGGMSVRGARERFDDFRLPDTPEGRRQDHATHQAETKRGNERDQYTEALHRVYQVIDALSVVSDSSIETTIEVKKPIFPGHPWLARLAMARSRGVTLPQYGHGTENHFDKKPTYFTNSETTSGWAMNFVYEGDQIYPKRLTPNRNRDYDLYIEKPRGVPRADGYRSWMGGMEAYDGRPPVDRYDLPRIVGTGDRMTTNKYGDRAIEGWTNPDKIEMGNIDVETTKLRLVGNYLIGLGAPLGITDHLDPALMPDVFQREPAPTRR